ncbi:MULTISPECIES: LysR family transcriptional regulator [Pigmentiphaga]|uniref:LysR family pca operon transcriptional activator n=1 Tax=Pigmentiphaga kullae TaxID=151784 RepID=A0A4Q7NGJ3_9BURK|nr:LysR family transcriptional regulator [Pigmentiphaga kullae]RZS84054.1 LysR family pca operon transcriptional activator [Pigmentiphaga kullae]
MSDLIRRLTLRHLRLLVMLGELGSVTRTAQLLHITQPAVSKAIRDLRDILHDPLFEPTPDGLAWTPAGKAALQRAGAILRNVEDLERDTARRGRAGDTPLGLGLTRIAEAVVATALPHALAERGVRVSLRHGTREQMHSELAAKSIHVAFGRCDAGFRLPDFEYHPLYAESYAIVCGRHHPLAGRTASLEELAGQTWVLPPPGTFAHHLVEQAFLAENLTPPAPGIVSTLGPGDVRLVETQPLLALAPRSEARRLEEAGTVSCVEGLTLPPQQIGAILLRAGERHPACELAIRMLRAGPGEAWTRPA